MGGLSSINLSGTVAVILVLNVIDTGSAEFNGTDVNSSNITKPCINEDGTPVNISESMISDFIFDPVHGRRWDRPVKHATNPIQVNVKLRLQRFIDINERNQLAQINGFYSFTWTDEIRRWDHMHPYNCVHYIVVPHGKETGVWIPEIAMINADSKYSVTANKYEQLLITSDGSVSMSPGGLIEFLCKMDLSRFPFDVQLCNIRLEPWRYSTTHMAFHDADIQAVNLTRHEQWEITNLSYKLDVVSYPSGYTFSGVDFYIHLRRKPGYYLFTVIMPCLLVAAVEIFTFSIPCNKGIRLEVSFTCLLAFTVFHTTVINELPKSADNPPLLIILISILTYLIGFAIFFQSITLFMSAKGDETTSFPPRIIFVLATSIAPFVFITPFKYKELLCKTNNPENARRNSKWNVKLLFPKSAVFLPKRKSRKVVQAAWQYIARTTDRCFCVMFILLFAIGSCLTLIVIPAIRSN